MQITNSTIEMMRRDASAGPEKFWAPAGQALPWRRAWDTVFDWDPERPDDRDRNFR